MKLGSYSRHLILNLKPKCMVRQLIGNNIMAKCLGYLIMEANLILMFSKLMAPVVYLTLSVKVVQI